MANIKTINHQEATKINRPVVEVVQYADSDTYTYQVSFPNATYTRKAEYNKKEAVERSKAFEDFFNDKAHEIETGGRKRFLMRTDFGLTNDDNNLWYTEIHRNQNTKQLNDLI